MLRLKAFRPTNDKIVKIQMHPTHPWLVTSDASDHVSVWNWEHRQVLLLKFFIIIILGFGIIVFNLLGFVLLYCFEMWLDVKRIFVVGFRWFMSSKVVVSTRGVWLVLSWRSSPRANQVAFHRFTVFLHFWFIFHTGFHREVSISNGNCQLRIW